MSEFYYIHPDQDGEGFRSEALRDRAWDFLPNLARDRTRAVEVNYITNNPHGFLRVRYEPDDEISYGNSLDIRYVEPIRIVSPVVETLVRELQEEIPIEESAVDLTKINREQVYSEKVALQIECALDGTTGEIFDFIRRYGPLNRYGYVEHSIDESDAILPGQTTEERLRALAKVWIKLGENRDQELESRVAIPLEEHVDQLLSVFDRV